MANRTDLIRVAVIDDHEVVRDGIKALIAAKPNLEYAGDGPDIEAAINICKDRSPDVMLLDISMKNGENGIEAIGRIREVLPSVKILIFSMFSSEQHALDAIRNRADGYLEKGCDTSEILKAIVAVNNGGKYIPADILLQMANPLPTPQNETQNLHSKLTNRELEVMVMIAQGTPLKNIGDALGISNKTVSAHSANIIEKLGVRNKTEMVAYAVRNGLVPNE